MCVTAGSQAAAAMRLRPWGPPHQLRPVLDDDPPLPPGWQRRRTPARPLEHQSGRRHGRVPESRAHPRPTGPSETCREAAGAALRGLPGPAPVVAQPASAVPGEDPPRPRLLVRAVRAEHHELRPLVGLHQVLVLDAALVGRQCADDSVVQAAPPRCRRWISIALSAVASCTPAEPRHRPARARTPWPPRRHRPPRPCSPSESTRHANTRQAPPDRSVSVVPVGDCILPPFRARCEWPWETHLHVQGSWCGAPATQGRRSQARRHLAPGGTAIIGVPFRLEAATC
jgi:hypothetical protein